MVRCLVQIRLAGHVLGIRVSNVALDLPEAIEALPERLAIVGVPVHRLKGAARDSHSHGREHDTLNLKVAHHADGCTAFDADETRGR